MEGSGVSERAELSGGLVPPPCNSNEEIFPQLISRFRGDDSSLCIFGRDCAVFYLP